MTHNAYPQTIDQTASIKCPYCGSHQVETLDRFRKTGRVVGAATGGIAGIAGTIGGAETGAAIGAFAGPVGILAGGLFGAAIGGLFGAAAGGTVGSTVGRAIDDNLTENYHCHSCDLTFGHEML